MRSQTYDEASDIRRELREETADLRKQMNEMRKQQDAETLTMRLQLDSTRKEVDDWRIKYFEIMRVNAECQAENADLKRDNIAHREEVTQVRQEVEMLRVALAKHQRTCGPVNTTKDKASP